MYLETLCEGSCFLCPYLDDGQKIAMIKKSKYNEYTYTGK